MRGLRTYPSKDEASALDFSWWRRKFSIILYLIYDDVREVIQLHYVDGSICWHSSGPVLFIKEFPAPLLDQQAKSMVIWEAFITHRLLTHRLRPLKSRYSLLSYQPNLVSRQFRLVQLKPKPLYEKKRHMCLHSMFSTKEGFKTKTIRYISVTSLTIVSFQSSFYCTQEFSYWWTSYYTKWDLRRVFIKTCCFKRKRS